MGRPLRGGRPHRGAHPRGHGGRQVARHSRYGPDGAQDPRGGHSGDLRNGVRGPLYGQGQMYLHHRIEREDHHHVAYLQDHARRGDERRPRRQHRREFRLVGRYGRLRLVCAGIELFPVGRNVSVPGACRGADEHYARSPRPLRPLFSELCRLENENRAEYDLARLVRLLGR